MKLVRFLLFLIINITFTIASAADKDIKPIDVAKLRSGEATLTIGHYEQLPPFYYLLELSDDSRPGLGAEIIKEVMKKSGIQKVNVISFNSLVNLSDELRQGKIDLIANSWDLPGMRKQFLLTEPYYTKGGLGFLYFKERGNFQTAGDLSNHSVGTLTAGYAYNYWLPAHGIAKANIHTYNNIKELMTALRNREIDVAVIYYPLARLAQTQSDQLTAVLAQPINDVYAMRKQDVELQTTLNQALDTLWADGTLEKIKKDYLDPADIDTKRE